MLTFRNRENKDQVEDQLVNMYIISLEVETQINAVLSMQHLVNEMDIESSQINSMIFHHNTLALILATFILKKNPKEDEVNPLCCLRKEFEKLEVNINKPTIKAVFNDIVQFYRTYNLDITKITNKRNSEAHFFLLDKRISTSRENEISFNKQIEIILKARNLISNLYTTFFEKDILNEIEYGGKYDVDIYEKIYLNGLQSLRKANI